ncbi:MAG: hypothetical protein HN981_04645 [Candidatus Pacebacteria bacterium]|jgi:hypothetical protein|nr:hypothetical protein [Candidatus Paceibacterota bacterium]MBT6756362.1 hypothetical protein [Candidatus Paceibacterota bacterium]MBT6921653.1 hypothetical protein [Candidatus Paceibacterota bacterium]
MQNSFNAVNFSLPLLMIFKYLLIALSGFYILFSFVIIRQIAIMKKTLITQFSPRITLIGWIHFCFSVLVFVSFLFFVQP